MRDHQGHFADRARTSQSPQTLRSDSGLCEDPVTPHHPDNLTPFPVQCPTDLPPAVLAATARDTGLDEVLPGDDHMLIQVDAVRRLAAGRVGPAWETEFTGMLAYAAHQGWVDENGTRVRAHIGPAAQPPSETMTSFR